MQVTTTAPRSYPARVVDLQAPIAWLCGIMMLLTFTLGTPILDLLMPYAVSGGNFLAKFHPASWLAPLLLLLVWEDYAVGWQVPVGHLIWGIGLLAALIFWLAMRGKGALTATFIDIYLVPAILLLALSRLPTERVRFLLKLFIALAVFNVFIVAIEFASQKALLPREGYERFFRPAGLFAHPIMAGSLFYCAMFLTSRGVVSAGIMRPLMLLFLVGVALCRVRGPLLMGGLIFLMHIVHPAVPRRRLSDYVLDFALVVIVPVAIPLAFMSDAFDRILELGIWDQSAQTRFTIFDTIRLLNEHQFWNGIDGYDVGNFLASQMTGSQSIENAFVSVILQAGFPVALMMAICLVIVHEPAIRHSLTFAIMLVVIAATTLGFGAKNMIPAAIALCGYWIQRQFVERQRRRVRAAKQEPR